MQTEPYIDNLTYKKSRFTWKHLVVLIVCGLIIPPLLSIGFVLFIAQPVKNEGNGMAPTIKSGDKVFFSKRVSSFQRGDIVVFYYPLNKSQSFIKRIVGLPNETIRIDANGNTYINGSQIDEPYLLPANNRHPRIIPETTIEPDHYYVLGDGRDFSNDSRSWGQVPKDLIYGKYMFTYWAASDR